MRQKTLVTLNWLKALVSLLAGDARDRRKSLLAFASHRVLVSLTEERCVVPSSAAWDGFCPALGEEEPRVFLHCGSLFSFTGREEGRQRWSTSLRGKDGELSVFLPWGGNKDTSCSPSAAREEEPHNYLMESFSPPLLLLFLPCSAAAVPPPLLLLLLRLSWVTRPAWPLHPSPRGPHIKIC